MYTIALFHLFCLLLKALISIGILIFLCLWGFISVYIMGIKNDDHTVLSVVGFEAKPTHTLSAVERLIKPKAFRYRH